MFLFLKWMENLLGSGKESKKMYKDKIAKKKKKKKRKYQLNVTETFKSRSSAQIDKPLNSKPNLN